MKKSSVHIAWMNIRQRCYNKNHLQYKDYGGRGIIMCDRWLKSFINFLEDMGERPEGYTIDRINNDGNYEPGNCRWATKEEQDNNRRTNRNLIFNGKTQNVTQWAKELDIKRSTIFQRLNRGWSIEKALTTPVKKNRINS